MNVLVCGATGCIGSAVCEALAWRGHRVVRGVRGAGAGSGGGVPGDDGEGRRESDRRCDPATFETMPADFAEPVAPEVWAERLRAARIDAVVNAAGILVARGGASFARVHRDGPLELFEGARRAGIGRIVQVSALGAGDAPAAVPYLHTKREADDALLALGAPASAAAATDGLDAAIVRPSLVYGPRSESGALFATLAALPVHGLPGSGRQALQPIHVFEVAEAIAALVERSGAVRGVYELGGGERLAYRDMLSTYRAALGLGAAIRLPLPMPLMRISARLAEALPQRVFSRDTVRLLEAGSVPARNAAPVLLGRAPSTLAEGLAVSPPEPAFDLRVALPPVVEGGLRAAIGFLWLYTAAISAALPVESGVLDLLARCGFIGAWGIAALVASCALNTALGALTLLRPGVHLYALQVGAIAGYTLTAAWNLPALTIDHCGPLAKNVPLLAGVMVLWLARASDPQVEGRQRRPALPLGGRAAERGGSALLVGDV